jgi:phage terminase large subunit-like protein
MQGFPWYRHEEDYVSGATMWSEDATQHPIHITPATSILKDVALVVLLPTTPDRQLGAPSLNLSQVICFFHAI